MSDWVVVFDEATEQIITEQLTDYRPKADVGYGVIYRGATQQDCAAWLATTDVWAESTVNGIRHGAQQRRRWHQEQTDKATRERNAAARQIVQAIVNVPGGPFVGTPKRCRFCATTQAAPPAPASHTEWCPYPASLALLGGG